MAADAKPLVSEMNPATTWMVNSVEYILGSHFSFHRTVVLRNIGINITRHCDGSVELDWKLEKLMCQGLGPIAVSAIPDCNYPRMLD